MGALPKQVAHLFVNADKDNLRIAAYGRGDCSEPIVSELRRLSPPPAVCASAKYTPTKVGLFASGISRRERLPS